MSLTSSPAFSLLSASWLHDVSSSPPPGPSTLLFLCSSLLEVVSGECLDPGRRPALTHVLQSSPPASSDVRLGPVGAFLFPGTGLLGTAEMLLGLEGCHSCGRTFCPRNLSVTIPCVLILELRGSVCPRQPHSQPDLFYGVLLRRVAPAGGSRQPRPWHQAPGPWAWQLSSAAAVLISGWQRVSVALVRG